MLSSADFQLTMNSEMPLSTHHLTKLFSGREVEDVETVDPRREDHDRRLQHLVRRRRVLDQLVERRLLDHLARRRREVAPDLEHARLGLGQLPRRNVVEHVGEALEQVLAARLERPLQHLRIGQREVRRAHRVDEAARREAQLLARLGVDALDLVDRAEQLVRNLQIGLADGVEDRVLAPFGRGEAAVLALLSAARRRGHAAEHLAPGLQPLRPGLRARAHQRHRIGRGAPARRSRTPAATRPGNGWPCLQLLGPEFHQHLLGAAHHQRPVLPVLERRDRARRFSVRRPCL